MPPDRLPDGVDPGAHHELAAERLGLDTTADAQAAPHLSQLLLECAVVVIDPDRLAKQLDGRPAIVLGPAPGGIKAVRTQPPGTPLIVAGSAVDLAMRYELGPRLVVTDLDGSPGAHLTLSRRGVATAVHAHGDNVDLLEQLVAELAGPVLGTSQTPPPDKPVPLHRFGGFTDGDRACFLAAALGASEIRLAGWDLDTAVGTKEEGDGDDGDEAKRIKLDIAAELLEQVPVPVVGLETPADVVD